MKWWRLGSQTVSYHSTGIFTLKQIAREKMEAMVFPRHTVYHVIDIKNEKNKNKNKNPSLEIINPGNFLKHHATDSLINCGVELSHKLTSSHFFIFSRTVKDDTHHCNTVHIIGIGSQSAEKLGMLLFIAGTLNLYATKPAQLFSM